MSLFDERSAEVFLNDGVHFVASYKNVLLQIRRGEMTEQILDQIESILRLTRARQKSHEGALLAILEESAELSTGVVRQRQGALIRAMLKHEKSWAATIVPEGTAKGALLRTFMRLLVLGHPQLGVFGTPKDAAVWLEKRLGTSAAELVTLCSWGRAKIAAKAG